MRAMGMVAAIALAGWAAPADAFCTQPQRYSTACESGDRACRSQAAALREAMARDREAYRQCKEREAADRQRQREIDAQNRDARKNYDTYMKSRGY
jgi:hypothetical protein